MFLRFITFIIVLGLGSIVLFFAYPPPSDTTNKSFTPVISQNDITIGWVGDMVPSNSKSYNASAFSFVTAQLQKPDLMIGNLEGTFAHENRISKCNYIFSRCHAFQGDASFADSIKRAGFDFVSLINNHSYDFGADGLKDTLVELDARNILYVAPTKQSTSMTIKGKRIGILGLSSTQPTKTITNYDFIKENVIRLKNENDFVIVIFHGGSEGVDKTLVPGVTEYMGTEDRGNVEMVAHSAIDAGADLVLGSGPHVLRKVEIYRNKTIAYSLGNFVGGNGGLSTGGTLGLSGIFMTTLSDEHDALHSFTSIILTKNGTPTIDTLDQGKHMIEKLSQ